jgi:hypothetical protein
MARWAEDEGEQGEGFFGFITGGGTYKEDKFARTRSSSPTTTATKGIMAQVGGLR